MRRFLACLFLTIFGIALVIVAGVYFLSKYAMLTETVDDIEAPESAALARTPPGALEIFSPIPKQVFLENPVTLEGKTQVENVLVLIDGKNPKTLSVDQDGRFKKNLTLHRGANQITVVAVGGGKELLKELVVGFYPEGKGGSYTALMGMIKNVSSEKKTFELIGPDDTLIKVDGSTKIFEVSESGKATPVSFSALDNTQRVGVIASRGAKGAFSPKDVRIALYPYNYFGSVEGKQSSSFVLKLVQGKRDVALVGATKVFRWEGSNLKSTSFSSVKVGDRVFVNGFVLPHESDPSANFILVL